MQHPQLVRWPIKDPLIGEELCFASSTFACQACVPEDILDGFPLFLGTPFEEVHSQMLLLQYMFPHSMDPHQSVRPARLGSCHCLQHQALVRLVSLTVAGHGHGLPQTLRSPLLVGGALCLAPACQHHGHPWLRPGVKLSQCWCLTGFAVGTTRTLV